MSADKVTSIRDAESPSKRSHEPSKASDIVSMIFGSNAPSEEKIKALAGLVESVSGSGNTSGQPPQPPGKVPASTWTMIALLVLGLGAEIIPPLLKDPTERTPVIEPNTKEITDLTSEVSGLREDLKTDRIEQSEFDYFLVEAIKDIEKQSGENPEGLTSVNYLERAQAKRERK